MPYTGNQLNFTQWEGGLHRWENTTYRQYGGAWARGIRLSVGDHIPVLLDAVVESARTWLADQPSVIIDGTVGEGGHLLHLVEACSPVEAFGLDRDPLAIERAKAALGAYPQVQILHNDYSLVPELIRCAVQSGRTVFVLLDLGLGSHQLASSGRGFSFRALQEPLDLRFDPSTGLAAWEWLAQSSPGEIAKVMARYGELRKPMLLARALYNCASKGGTTVGDYLSALPAVAKRPDGLARLFQALRIQVNQELERLDEVLDEIGETLNAGSVVVAAIGFHSLEDRRIKSRYRSWQSACVCPPGTPICICGKISRGRQIPSRGIVATAEEREKNPRSRSARLRIFVSQNLLRNEEKSWRH